nr:long chain base biosynthesis protein 2A-like [Ipomoea batatas]
MYQSLSNLWNSKSAGSEYPMGHSNRTTQSKSTIVKAQRTPKEQKVKTKTENLLPTTSYRSSISAVPGGASDKMVEIPYFAALTTFFSYVLLFAFGHFRDFFRKIFDWWHPTTDLQGYAPICLGLEDFYIRRLYHRIQFLANNYVKLSQSYNFAGTVSLHTELEECVANFVGKPAAIVFGMGYATNSTVLPALIGKAIDLYLRRNMPGGYLNKMVEIPYFAGLTHLLTMSSSSALPIIFRDLFKDYLLLVANPHHRLFRYLLFVYGDRVRSHASLRLLNRCTNDVGGADCVPM